MSAAPRRFDRLLRPRTIAVFGGRAARRVMEQCDKLGFQGEIWPVHPRHREVAGRPCFTCAEALPGAPDAAFIGVNRHATVEIVGALAKRGAGGAVCYASGFREAEAELAGAAQLEDALIAAAGPMPILGPNCYGLVNALDGAPLWPDQHGLARADRGVAILAQSSNIAINLSMQTRGLPIAYLATLGNQAQTGLSELAGGLLADPRVTALGMYIEGFDDVAALERLAGTARALGKPMVALKVGKSPSARRATVSHTASLAGDDAASDALFRRFGIGRVHTLPAFLEALKLLHVHGPLKGFDICSMSCSGGEVALMADAAERYAVRFRPLDAARRKAVKETLGEIAAVANPLDYHTFIWGDEARLGATFAAMMDGGFDLSMVMLDFPRRDRCDDGDWRTTRDALVAAARKTGRPAAIVSCLGETMPEPMAREIMAAGVAPLSEIDAALAATDAAAWIGRAWAAPPPPPLLAAKPRPGEIVTLDEATAKARLAAFGLPIPIGRRADTPAAAAEAADGIGYPVALKGLGVAHKTEAGAVALGLRDGGAVRQAAAMGPVAVGYLVERMAPPPVAELIVGAARDPAVGLVLTMGAGGILAELMGDTAVLTLPASETQIREAVGSLGLCRLIEGYRGAPRGDMAATVAAIGAVARYIEANVEVLEELDINPLMVLPEGQGVLAVDALIRTRKDDR